MRRLLRFAAVLPVVFLLVLPARSSGQGKDDHASLSNLLTELKESYDSALESDSLLVHSNERRAHLSKMVKAVDEVSIMLYSQRTGFAFDLAFSMDNVAKLQELMGEHARLSDKYMRESRSGLLRYTMLEGTLRDMYMNHPVDSLLPTDSLLQSLSFKPLEVADSLKSDLLDSCLRYTGFLTDFYKESVMLALQDSIYFAETDRRLQQAYDYAQASYADSQKNRFIVGNVNVIQILRNWKTVVLEVKEDLRNRYDLSAPIPEPEEGEDSFVFTWNGTEVLLYAMMALFMLFFSLLVASLVSVLVFKRLRKEKVKAFRPILSSILAVFLFVLNMLLIRMDGSNPYWEMAYRLLTQFAWLTLAIFLSLLIRIQGNQARASRNLYIPTLLLLFLCILMRAIFLPASIVPIVFPPVLLVFIIWQSALNFRYRRVVCPADLRYMWASVGVMGGVEILSLVGYSMIGVLIVTFWTFLLALLHTITTLYYLMIRYYEDHVIRRKARFHQENPLMPLENKDAFIEVTWLYDLLGMAVVPVMALASVPASLLLTGKAYQLAQNGAAMLDTVLFNRKGFEFVTLHNLILVLGLFFIFRYLIYLVKALYRVFKFRRLIEKNPRQTDPFKESDVNLSLPNTIFTLTGWLAYILIVFAILHIPTSALTAITTGLAAGIGFALKDLINNFFYGIQLMAGRIRVGDKISCDGVRGVVKRVSYQTTQVEDEDGSLIAFTNTDLFSKNFRNLNTGKNYELIKMPVSVKYGTDVAKARQVILEALQDIQSKDKYGRDIVDPVFGIDVRFDGFGDSCIQLIVALYTTVETHYTFPSRAKEAIYNAFAQNGIEIPFPQRDVHLKQD